MLMIALVVSATRGEEAAKCIQGMLTIEVSVERWVGGVWARRWQGSSSLMLMVVSD